MLVRKTRYRGALIAGASVLSMALAMTLPVMTSKAWAASDAPAQNTRDLALLNRLTWGETASSAAQMRQVGAKRWLEAQLRPSADDRRLPPEAQAQVDALPDIHTGMAELVVRMDAMNKAANQQTDPDMKKTAQQAYQQGMSNLAKEAADRSLMRDLYAPDQLNEQMTWFWMNHFNVHMYKRDIRAMIADYEDQAIRPRALGHFRDLLEATLRHPAMLRYLDNDQNAAGHINENYAREIMELHTMGVGSGYTQTDVQELARILTGVGVNITPNAPKLPPNKQALYLREGLFEFNPNRHDFGDKMFLGHVIHGSGFDEVRQALDILSKQPATAHHVSLQLATYYMGDNPPEAVVKRMTDAFQQTDGDIAQVMRAMITSRAFDASLGQAFKDPMHYAVSAVRQAYDGRTIVNTTPMQNWLNRMAEGLYNHETPDGYPMTAAAWNGPGQMAVRFEIARQIGSGSAGLFKPDMPGATDQPAFPQLQNALYFNGLSQSLSSPTKTALGQAVNLNDWNTLFLSSPEFMRR
jgi:uncharacterized protein (DUF1800 family)